MNGVSSPPASLDLGTSVGLPNFVTPYTFKCELCQESLLNPMQTQCGHRLCANCLERHFRQNGDPSLCPYQEDDCIQISRRDKTVFPDFVLIKDLKEKEVYCRYKDQGCQVITKWGIRKAHEDYCEYGKVPCPNAQYGCDERPHLPNLGQHQNECAFKPEKCPYCEVLVGKTKMKEHVDTDCPKSMTDCPFLCYKGPFPRDELKKHMESCPEKPLQCKFSRMGCEYMGTHPDMEKHLKVESQMHLELVTTHCERLEQKMKELEEKQKESMNSQSSRLKNLEGGYKLIQKKVSRQEHRMQETEKVVVEQMDTLKELETKVSSAKGRGASAAQDSSESEDCKRKSVLVSRNLQELEKKLSESIAEQRKSQESINQLTQKLTSYELRFQVLETASYDGILLWKIRDYHRRKADAKNGGVLSLYSQPFYTSRHGYRLCARVYLNGDGMGANSHMSLFFVVMKGEYDPLLKWPFRQRVSLMILDQTNSGRHIVDTFRPDPSSSSFQQPRTNMNVASGCPLFISHSILEAPDSVYLRNDTVFIKIAVDVPDIVT